ncbi:DNA repair protein complementing XP-G cells isoform X2 [Teleopsis dalmanni]|uniref:DNA repair protein complementing XP-G cells isoform X2 n=1 Tax=Teleopsis dalmanni TaxID=139649 RepID=UPI0018CE57A1|nr:DNA repair protein complementing XP-G cells isoform X2 [Teleopsis dalmanni]
MSCRRKVQKSMKEAQEEMGGKTINMSDIENIFIESGVIQPSDALAKSATISSDEHTRFWLVRDLKRKSEMENLKKNIKLSDKQKITPQTETTSELAIEKEIKDTADVKQIVEVEDVADVKQIDKNEKDIEDYKQGFKKAIKQITGTEQEQIDFELAIALSLEDLESREKTKSEPLRLNAIQRKHLKDTAVGPARAYMIEYGHVNMEEVEHIMDSTQISMNFESNVKEDKCDSTVNIIDSDDDDLIEVPSNEGAENLLPLLQQKNINENIEKPDCLVVESSSSDDSDFEEVPDISSTQATEKIRYDDTATTTINPHLQMKSELSKFQKALEDRITTTPKKPNTSAQDTKNASESPAIEISDDENKNECKIKETLVQMQKTISLEPTMRSNMDIACDVKTDNHITSPLSSIAEEQDIENTAELLTNSNFNTKPVANEIKPNVNEVDEVSEKNIKDLEIINEHVSVDSSNAFEKIEKNNDDINGSLKTPDHICKPLKEASETDAKVEHITENTFQLQDIDISEQLQQLHDIQEQRKEFELQRNRKERMGMTISQRMISDCQELLRLFGIPYIVAPMEAEAQCAFLDEHHITHGTITDDSDIWLFGGRTVYKNFFDNKKHVYEFKAEEIINFYHCDRKKLVQLACLVGSDYTLGIHGIGTTLGLEILSEFSLKGEYAENNRINIMKTLKSLQEFQEWALLHQNSATISPGTLTRVSLKKKLEKIQIPEGFPSLAVIEAYLSPKVDEIKDAFKWGQPDLDGIIGFTRKKMSWTREKTETILKPVLNKLNQKTTQKSIRNYFAAKKFVRAQELQVSKRVQNAIRNMVNAGEQDIVVEDIAKRNRKKKTSRNKPLTDQDASSHDDTIAEDDISTKKALTTNQKQVSKNNSRNKKNKSNLDDGVKKPKNTAAGVRSKKETKNTTSATHIEKPAVSNIKDNDVIEQIETKATRESLDNTRSSKRMVAQANICKESIHNHKPLRKRTNITTNTKSVEESLQIEEPTISKRAKGPNVIGSDKSDANSLESKGAAMFLKNTTKTEVIPQREKQKNLMDKNKEKAVELFKKLKDNNAVKK